MKTITRTTLACAILLALGAAAQARIKLTTLPERQTVRVDIQNGRYTLVEEERTVNLQAGDNQVDFAWANISIDKDSIVFRVIQADGAVNVLNTNYPPNENALYWTVSAAQAGPAVIRISYLIGNMEAAPSFQGTVENDEKTLLLQVYMTVTNTSGESFGECTMQPGLGKAVVRYFLNGERKRMLAAKFEAVPIQKCYVFDAVVDQQRTRMYYRLLNDKANNLGAFPLPYGKARLFIKEPKSENDPIRSQAFLGEDWLLYTPLFAPADLYIGVAQDVRVERFKMNPEGGPRAASYPVTCPRITLDGRAGFTKVPHVLDHRTRFRYRLENFKTENGKPVSVPLTIREHVDGEWVIEHVELKEITGERDKQKERVVPHEKVVKVDRIDVNNVEFQVDLAPTTIDKKYDLYVTTLRKNRR